VLIDCAQGVLTPGFVDSHTHAIFGRARYEEQEMRAAGVGYLEIAKRGGGIHSSVRDLRTRSEATSPRSRRNACGASPPTAPPRSR
jgi:imidazolonepropionase